MVNGKEKTFEDFIKDLRGMGIEVKFDDKSKLFKAIGLKVEEGKKQGICVVNCLYKGGRFPNLYFKKYGVGLRPIENAPVPAHHIIPT